MSKKTEDSFSSVISINPYNHTYLSGISSFLSETKSPQYQKKQYAISCLNTQGFINSQIAITKNIPEEDLYDAINNKVYDDLALDQAVTYQIQFIETFNNLDEDNRHFHVFIIDPLTITQTYREVVKEIKYIDVIIPAPLLLKSLYSKEIIEDSGVHCFIYLQENDAFVTLYNEKEFIYTKSINYSYIQMHDKFCEYYGERIEYEEFINFLSNESLRDTNSKYKEYFIRLYKELFANVNDILTYVKRAYEIEKINHIYVGSQVECASKLDEMAEVELSIKSFNLDFDYGYEDNGVYIDQLHALMHIYTTLPEEDRYECNFTTFIRPPKFTQRDSGKLIILTAASFLIAFIYPVTYWILTYAQILQYDLLQQEYREQHNIKTTREATIKNRETDREKISVLLAQEKEEYLAKKGTLIKINEVKVKYPMKAMLLHKLTKELTRFNVNLQGLSYSEDDNKNFRLNLIASRDKSITNLLEFLTKEHEGKFNFSLEEISYDEDSSRYLSELKVKLL